MDAQIRVQLSNRIETCKNEIELAIRRVKADQHDLSFWKHELLAAEAELHGVKQHQFNFQSCPTCGD